MFENILPHQIILLWMCMAGLSGTLISFMVSEGKKPLYTIATMFSSAFAGVLFGGFFVALTDALVWEYWSLLIPVFIGGIVAILVTVYLADKLPTPNVKVKPIALAIAIIMVIVLSFAPAMTISQPTRLHAPQVDFVSLNLGTTKLLKPASQENIGYVTLKDVLKRNIDSDLLTTLSYTTNKVMIDSYHTNIEFPTKLSEDAQEGDYIGFKLTFSVSSSSPTDWKMPAWFVFVWGDVNGNGQMDDSDVTFSEQFFKIPSQAGLIYTSAPCVYDKDGNPLWAMYGVNTGSGYQLLPVTFALWGINGTSTPWKDDSKYTFANTPEGFKPPYDQASWQIDASGTLSPKESVWAWVEIKKGDSYPVYGKIYCPYGMSNYTSDWYLTVIAYDYAYSTSEAVATHSMHFVVQGPQKPVVNVASEWWIEASLLFALAVIGVATVKYGSKFAFK